MSLSLNRFFRLSIKGMDLHPGSPTPPSSMRRFDAPYRLLLMLAFLSGFGLPSDVRATDSPDRVWFTDEVRVSLWGDIPLDDIVVIPRARDLTLMADGDSWTVPADVEIHLRRAGDRVALQFGAERVTAHTVSLEGHVDGAFDLRVPAQNGLRTYTGSLDIVVDPADDDLHLINRVPLEDYVASVVGAEYGLDSGEGAKAMAVVARTYALFSLRQERYLHDSERSQVYQGLNRANAAARQAADATAGEVITWGGDLIEAVYSASNGGRTASNTSAWGSQQLPYFTPRKDPWDARVSPHASWEWQMEAGNLESALARAFDMGEVRNIEIRQRAEDGRVTRIRLEGPRGTKDISGNAFRSAVSRAFGVMTIKSVYFDMSLTRNGYRFNGRGFGHGVGMSQWGAHGMAKEGRSYREILEFYYAGTSLERISSQAVPTRLTTVNPWQGAPELEGSGDVAPTGGNDAMAADASGPDSTATSDVKKDKQTEQKAGSPAPKKKKSRRIGW
jgi:stage II sporulation protein D